MDTKLETHVNTDLTVGTTIYAGGNTGTPVYTPASPLALPPARVQRLWPGSLTRESGLADVTGLW